MRLRWNDFLGLFGVHECVVSTKAYCDNASVLKSRLVGWFQWVDATLSSNPPYIENKS